MPAGIGLHPFFPWPESLRVQATVKQMHVMSAQGLPCAVDADHPAVQALREGQALHAGLDNLFEGWDGSAVLHMPWGRLRIRADAAYGFLCINSSPADRAYCCIEPVTHTTNALHRPHLQGGRTGHVLLAPGEALEATAWFDPEFNDD
jgi:aldose 1-epimerase